MSSILSRVVVMPSITSAELGKDPIEILLAHPRLREVGGREAARLGRAAVVDQRAELDQEAGGEALDRVAPVLGGAVAPGHLQALAGDQGVDLQPVRPPPARAA